MSGTGLEAPPRAGDAERPPLTLPELGHEGLFGARMIHRVVGLTFGVLAVVGGAGLLLSFLMEIDVTVKAAGTLEPVRVWPVRAVEAGTVDEVRVATGDTVEAGAALVQLDTLALASALAQLEAERLGADIARRRSATAAPVEQRQQGDRVDQARARLVTARATLLQRMVELDLGRSPDSLLAVHRPGHHVALDLAVAEVREAEAALRVAQAQGDLLGLERFDRQRSAAELARLDAQIAATRERLRRLTIPAPIRGVVLTEGIERLPGAFVGEGDVLLEVGDPREWRATLFVRERDVSRIEVGDSVRVEVQAFGAAERELLGGAVVSVAQEPVAAGGAAAPGGPALFRVETRLDRGQLAEIGMERFRRGYTVQGQVITRSGRIATLLWEWLVDRVSGRG